MPSPAPIGAPSPAQVRVRVLALLPAIFLGAIDSSIVPVALLSIGRALGDVSSIAWVMAGYLVAGTVATPLYGKLSDLYGRRRMLAVAILVSMAGSALAAVSTSMPMLIGARVLQGLGSGTLFALSQAAAADFLSGPDRARWQGAFSGVFASAALAAPLAGAWLTEAASWRAVFAINLPLAAIALACVLRTVPAAGPRRVGARIDGIGAALLAAGLGTVLVALARVGHGAGWLGASTLGLVAAGVALLVVWVRRESGAPEPIVPLSLFGQRVVRASCAVAALSMAVLVGCTVLLPLWMQTVGGAPVDEVALRLIALTLAVPSGAFVAGRAMPYVAHVGRLVALGCALASGALVGLALVRADDAVLATAITLPLGLGIGMTLPTVIVASQMSVGPALIGTVTALVAFFRSLGGVVGVAVLTSLALGDTGGPAATGGAAAAAYSKAFVAAAVAAALAGLAAMRIDASISRAAAAGGSGGGRS